MVYSSVPAWVLVLCGCGLLRPALQQVQAQATAPLEPASGVYLGAWVDSAPGTNDSPSRFNDRLGHKASLFQLAESLPLNFSDPPPTQLIDQTSTDCILLMTVYPFKNNSFTQTGNEAFEQMTQPVIAEFAKQIGGWIKNGRKIMVRLAPEMNGGWNPYGQRPLRYVAFWRNVVLTTRAAVTSSGGKLENLAFLWSPNVGNGYPFVNGGFNPFTAAPYTRANAVNATEFAALDTNNDGSITGDDDPYSPYWPGADVVDWVGLSVYYYGRVFPWEANVVPPAGVLATNLEGGAGGINFYQIYSGDASAYRKPMMISETAAAFHQYLLNGRVAIAAGDGELAIKQAYWRQYITNSTFYAAHPRLKGLCLFEFEKPEETTMRDFRIVNKPEILSAFKADLERDDVFRLYRWGNVLDQPIVTAPGGSSSSPRTVSNNAFLGAVGAGTSKVLGSVMGLVGFLAALA